MDWISKADIFGVIKKLYDDADTGTSRLFELISFSFHLLISHVDNDDQVTFTELAAWMQKAEAEITWLKNLCVEIKAFHAPK